MKGIELSKLYFEQCGLPLLEQHFGEYIRYMAFGLVGEGSECFFLDDEISQDHDFGPGFCIWLPKKIYKTIAYKLENILNKMPIEFMGYKREVSSLADKRIGVFAIEDFYYKYTKCSEFPINDQSWLEIPDTYLATVCNGTIFLDNYGEFTRIRNYLLEFYPVDILKKKIAANLAYMAQSGQYNLYRSYKRNDLDAYYFSKAEFLKSCFSTLFLLAGEYIPYYKLMARKLKSLNYFPEEVFEDINLLQRSTNFSKDNIIIERICSYISEILRLRFDIYSPDSFLISKAQLLQESIESEFIRNLHIMKGSEHA